jgi:hypothetical protein
VTYELRASASVYWRGEKRLITEQKVVDVVQGLDDKNLTEYVNDNDATAGKNGKLWMRRSFAGSRIITAGECRAAGQKLFYQGDDLLSTF